jgi:hypothetical protein
MQVLVRLFLLVAFALAVCSFPAHADEISDQIKEALGLYEKGDFSEAVTALSFAVGQIQQKQSSGLQKVFPEPLEGWKAEETTGEFAGTAFMGGGFSASRHYYVEDSDKSIDIEIVTDSPLLQSVLMFYTNPAFHAGQPDTKLVKIQGYKAMQKFSAQDQGGEINIVLGSRMLVSVKGHGLDKIDPMTAYANAIDYGALEKMLQK